MEEKLDLRIQKTHKALIGAFLELLEEKRFENITVNEICERAMVRRATFYKHFGDKYEFFTFLVQYLRDDFRNKKEHQPKPENPVSPYVEIFRFALDFLDEHDKLVRSVMESSVYPMLTGLVSEQIFLDVKKQLIEDEKNGAPLLLSPDILAKAYTGALSSVSEWWVSHKNQESKEEMIAKVTVLLEKLHRQ